MLSHPENQLSILAVPAVANVVGEETPRVAVVLILHEDTDPVGLAGLVEHVFFPQNRQEKRTGRVHDGDVGKQPAAVVGLQEFDNTEEEGVLRNRSHRIVGDTSRSGTTNPRRVSEKRIQAAVAAIVKVNVGSTVVGQDKVTDRVGALDGVLVAIEGVKEPGVFFGDKVTRFLVGPENVLVIRVQVDTASLSINPNFRDRFILVGLVNDLGDDLRPLLDQTRIGRRKLCAVDCVGRGIFHQ